MSYKKPLSQDSHSDLNVLDFKGQIEVKVGKKSAVVDLLQEINNKPFLVTGPLIPQRDPQSVLTATQGSR